MEQNELEEALNKARERLRSDFELWAAKSVKIRTKLGEIKPLILNRPQRRFVDRLNKQWLKTGMVRFVVLKARQMGFSTVIMAWQMWRLTLNKAQKGLVMAHVADSTAALFDQYKRCYENLPEPVKPTVEHSNRKEFRFGELDSAINIATAGGKGVKRGDTLTVLHLSEVGFWPPTFAKDNFAGLIKCVPQMPGTAVFIESTANGMTGEYREKWVGAVEGHNEFEPFFAPWIELDEYRAEPKPGFMRTPEEDELAEVALKLYGIVVDDWQLQWRRTEIGRDGIDKFHQECPLTPDEAFLNTGSPVFEPKLLHPLITPPREPLSRWFVGDGTIERNSAGELLVYHDYPETALGGRASGLRTLVSPAEVYVIGVDVGMGIRGKDYSVAQVLDSQGRQVAVWRGIIHPDYFAKILNTLGLYYNSAMLNVERNNHGLLTCVKLRDLGYPNLYTEVTEGALDDRDSINIGTYVTERNKPLIIDELRAALRDSTIHITDPTTVREMLTYVVNETGRMGGDGDSFDDTVMALAHAWHICERTYEISQTPEELYVEGI